MEKKSKYGMYLDNLTRNKFPHSISYTNKTKVVKSTLGRVVFTSSNFNFKGMNFVKKVKKDVLGRLDSLQHLNEDYFKKGLKLFSDNLYIDYEDGTKYGNVVEIDLNKAYWVSAHKLGIISTDIYNEGLKGLKSRRFTKVDLLAALGGLAVVKRKKTFNPESMNYSTETVNDSSTTRFLWNAISWEVDRCMQEIESVLGDEFLFYWTDAAFMVQSNDNTRKTYEVIHKHGFEAKEVRLEYINADHNKKHGGLRVFAWTKSKKGKATNPLVDDEGNFGREFPFERRNVDAFFDKIFKELKKEKNTQENEQ